MARKKKRKKQDGKSIVWVGTAGVILVALFSWGCMANAYANSIEDVVAVAAMAGGRARSTGLLIMIGSVFTFVIKSFTQIPSFFSVISWNLTNRKGLLIFLALLQIAVIGATVGLKMMEQHLAKGERPDPDL